MKEFNCDIHIVGGALTGLLAAYCSSTLGYKIIVSEKKNISDIKRKPIRDTRTTAIAEGSKIFLEKQGLWNKIRNYAEPIKEIKVIDKTANTKLPFKNPKNKSNLGYIVQNSKLISILNAELKKKKNVNLIKGSKINSIINNNSNIISFSNNTKIVSTMIIAADGKNSAVRKILDTKFFTKTYNEKALVINFSHEKHHNNVAFEFFLKTGPLAILPMKKENLKNQSTIIWSNKPEIVDMISGSKFSNQYLKEILNEKIYQQLGNIIDINSIQAFPLSAHINEKFYDVRTVYVGDAAHSIHPIAGQGWNLGLRDVKSITELLALAKSGGDEIGLKSFCINYNNLCYYDAYRLFEITDKLDWIFKKDQSYFKLLKKLGFKTINSHNALKEKIVEFAMGV